jgi:hypothetical protein
MTGIYEQRNNEIRKGRGHIPKASCRARRGAAAAAWNPSRSTQSIGLEVVIKAAVIAEVALGEAIQRVLTSAERDQITEKIDQGLGPKVRVARRFGLLSREQCDYLREVSAMRNVCVHDRQGLRFTFRSYLREPRISHPSRSGLAG